MPLWIWIAVALAQSSAPDDEPLAIPIDQVPASPPAQRPTEAEPAEGPLAIPLDRAPTAAGGASRALALPGTLSAGMAQARRAYARQRLSVRPITEFTVTNTAVGPGWGYGGWGYGGWGWGGWGWGGMWSAPMVSARDGWAIFEGDHRIDVPTALERFDEVPTQVDLERRIRRGRAAGQVWTGVGVAGMLGGVVSLVGLDQARSYDEARLWSTAATGSLLAGVTGLVVGTFPAARARRLAVDPSLTLSRQEAEEQADTANDALRATLGLSPEEALMLERPEAVPRRR